MTDQEKELVDFGEWAQFFENLSDDDAEKLFGEEEHAQPK